MRGPATTRSTSPLFPRQVRIGGICLEASQVVRQKTGRPESSHIGLPRKRDCWLYVIEKEREVGVFIPLHLPLPRPLGSGLMSLVGSLDETENSKSCEGIFSTPCCITGRWSVTYPDVSDGSLETILFKRLRTLGLGWIPELWLSQTKRLETFSKSRRNGATAGNTRVYTANALKHALIAWCARLGVKAVGFIAKHCSSVIPP